MKQIYFSFGLEEELQVRAAGLMVSSEFKKEDVINLLRQNLQQTGFVPDVSSLKFVRRGNHVFLEGLANAVFDEAKLEAFF